MKPVHLKPIGEARGFFDLPVSSILQGYKKGTLTPADVARICIRQVEQFEPDVLAWECFDKNMLLVQAKDISARLKTGAPVRPLDGIPVGIKDVINTADFTTQMGSPIWKGFTPGNDARVVYYLKQAGATIPGKTVTAEFAVHTLGKTKNPHDPSRTPGTSSSGSAVAIATGMVPVALGTQTAGSIVRPASFCGVYGCKPSFGLIPRTGTLKTTDSLDTMGFFTLHFADLERVFDTLRVHGTDYPISNAALTDTKRQNRQKNRLWRVAFVRTHLWEKAYPYARTAMERWAGRLAEDKEIQVAEKDLPESMNRANLIHQTIYDKTLSYYFKEEFRNDRLVSPIMKDLIVHGKSISVERYQHALKEQERLESDMDTFFGDTDIMISLATAGHAPLREEPEQPDPALMWTMTHLPVVCAPVFVSIKGLPFGVQIAARRYNDLLLFKFCQSLDERGHLPDSSYPKVSLKNH